MADITERRAFAPAIPWRTIAVALLLLALVAGTVAVYVGTQRTRVPPPFGPASNGLMAFSVEGDTWTLDPATGVRTLLSRDANNDFGAEFSPDGTRVAILSIAPGGGNRIRITSLDGETPVFLAPDPFIQLHGWQWSPDGQTMATIHSVDGTRSLSIVPTDGGPIRTLDLGGLTAIGATWRPPDGRELLLTGQRDGMIGLYAVGADGSGLRLLHGPEPAVGPLVGWADPNLTHLGGAGWSPDGTRIAYMAVRTGPGGDPVVRAHVVDSDGSGDRELVAPEGVSDTWPIWSPDGRRLVTARIGGGETWPAVLDLDGRALDLDRRGALATGSLTVAGWSPDGEALFLLEDGVVAFIDPDTGAQVGEPLSDLDWPSWQRRP